ncbi:hypothetical protein T484DRAFT_2798129 [Baffinella frigidus]|nr:hypothetical protein T484DRAFT_2798129 [Cryptophyta sp. CCMP2293]
MEDFRSEGAVEGLQCQAEIGFLHNIPRQLDTLAREPAATPRRCSLGGEGRAPGWCTDRPLDTRMVLRSPAGHPRREPAAPPLRCSPGGEGHAPGWCTDRPLHTLAREPASTPRRCSPDREEHASGWCTDRPDHRPWSDRTSSAASAASTSAASTAQWGVEGASGVGRGHLLADARRGRVLLDDAGRSHLPYESAGRGDVSLDNL